MVSFNISSWKRNKTVYKITPLEINLSLKSSRFAFSYKFFINISEDTYPNFINTFTHMYECDERTYVVCMLSCVEMQVYLQAHMKYMYISMESVVDIRCLFWWPSTFYFETGSLTGAQNSVGFR